MTAALGPRMGRRWVRWYTRSCPPQVAAERIEEIDSDLWEHSVDAAVHGTGRVAHDVDVMRRVLSGVPADLSWRRETMRAHRHADSQGAPVMSRPREIAALAVIILASIGVMIAFTLLPLLGQSGSGSPTSGERWWIVSATAVGALLLGGLVLRLREQSPRLATTLMALGAPAPALAWFWFPPLYALSAVLLVLVFVTHRRGPVMAV